MLPLHGHGLDNRLGSRLLDRLGNRLVGVFVFVIHHCFCPFQRTVVVLYACIIPSESSKVKPNKGLFRNFLRLDFTPTLPLEAVVNPHDNHCHC